MNLIQPVTWVMRTAALVLALSATATHAQDARIYQTNKHGTARSLAYVVKDDKVYQTNKHGTSRTLAYVVKDDKVYQTNKHGTSRQMAFVIKRPQLPGDKP